MVTYKDAGVDIDAGNRVVENLRQICPDIGGFSGLFPFGEQYLVASTDGVGTKLALAQQLNQHKTIGIDLVAMCVNDILTSGAKPLFFLDYIATGKINTETMHEILTGVIEGCRQAGCPLLGGETAEMPGFYSGEKYDVAGFTVGVVDKKRVVDGSTITEGDQVIALPSSGFHSNGYSLVRKVIADCNIEITSELASDLLQPTRIYVDEIHNLLEHFDLKGMAHITGGGITENIPRCLPEGLGVLLNHWEAPRLFQWLQQEGGISQEEMYRTFNMGVGFVVVVSPEEAQSLCARLPDYRSIGTVVKGKGVQLR